MSAAARRCSRHCYWSEPNSRWRKESLIGYRREQVIRSNQPQAMAAFLDVNHSGETYRVVLKRASAARRFTLRVRAASRDVLLTMPGRGALADARDFAQRHAAWIGARLRRLPAPVPFAPGELIPFRGETHLITHRQGARGTVWVEDILFVPNFFQIFD